MSQRAAQRTGALVAISLHALAGAALLTYEPTRAALLAVAPIMVELIAPPRIETQPEPRVEPPKPRPVKEIRPRPPVELPVLVAAPEAPSPAVAPPPIAATLPEPDAVAPAPAAVTPPIFHADYLDNPAPAYPALSRRLGEQGRVTLRVQVNPRGTAGEVQIHASSGYSRLDEAARETVRRWKFVPAKRGAQPIEAWVLIPISFRLEG